MKLRRFFLLIVLAVATIAQAQMPQALPADPAIRTGKLDNGLTYYVRHNERPEHVANFYIAQRVGSIQENDDQRGLAHFLEHMAFNGSKNFQGNGIIDYTRSLGVAFGQDLNAYTSIEETVYNINNVPTARVASVDSCLLILKDWSCGLLLLDEEIDKERGVIHGEWAMRNSANQRLFERNLPKMYPGCKYGERMPIGTMEIVDNFKYEALRQYYEKWYHPENQAIIVVGDIDVDRTEAKIKEMFADIKAGPNAAHVEPVVVPDNAEAIYIFDKDKEMQMSNIGVMLKSDPLPEQMKGTIMQYATEYMMAMVCSMFNSRMSEIMQQPGCPFAGLSMGYGKYLLSKTKDCIEFEAVAKEGQEKEVLATIIREAKRVKQYGFTASEFVRAKDEFLSRREKAYDNRDKREHGELYRQMVNNYLEHDAMPDPETEYQIWQMLAQQCPLEAINQAVAENLTIDSDNNFVCYLFGQDKEGLVLPSADEMRQIVEQTRGENVEAWVDNAKDEPLIAKMPKAGKIVKETENSTLGLKELTLSNGAKVVLKHTDFKNTEILMQGWSEGGKSMYGAADYSNLKLFDAVASACGLGNFSNTELDKALAGKQASVGLTLGNRYNYITGSSTPKDLETMMQLLYLHFTSIQKDEKAYNTLMSMLETQLKNRDLQPEATLSDSLTNSLQNHNPRFASVTVADLPNVSYDRVLAIAKERFSNANNFTFTFVGNFDEAQLRQYICQYIASLPKKEKKVKSKDVNTYFSGKINNEFTRKMETPKPMIVEILRANCENTLENAVLAEYIGEVLSMVLLQSVREDAGAAYSVGASSALRYAPEQTNILMQIYAPISDPTKVDIALQLMDEGIQQMCENTDADMVAKVKANLLKQADVNAKQNNYWNSVIQDYYLEGIDSYTTYKQIVEGVTPEKISAFLKNTLVAGGNHLKVVMRPEE